jgi:DNA-binding Lrp family transcriptional regulator
MDKISKMPAVTSVDRTEGRYELFVKIRGETEGDIRSIVAQEFDSISGVDATLVMMIAQP